MLKKEIRRLYKEKRKEITVQQKEKWDDLLLIQFQKMQLPFLSSVLSFYPIAEKNEIDTFIITDYLAFKNPGLQVAYPRTDNLHHTMQAVVPADETAFAVADYNIPEPLGNALIDPEDLDLVLVPMMAFDLAGNRVGYGKGYYDKFLKECRDDALKLGLCYFEPLPSIADAAEFDVTLDYCITPQMIYVF